MAKVKEDTTTGTVDAASAEAKTAQPQNEQPQQVDPNLVVAVVKKRYTIVLPDRSTATYAPGNVTMPREHAEHWYSKANGTEIIGIPDNGDLNGVGAKFRLNKLIETLSTQRDEAAAFESQHHGLSKEQKEAFNKAEKFIDGAIKLLGAL